MLLFKKVFQAFTSGERFGFLAVGAVTLASGSVLLSFTFVSSTTPVPAYGGEYTEGFVGQPVYINPVIASSDIDKSLVRLVFENLGELADKISTSSESRIWNVRLKENLRWQDDSKLTSDDIIFTVQRIQDPETRSPLYEAWQGVSMQRLSELEVQFSLVNPYAFFPETLRGLYVLPRHLFAEIPSANWRLSDYNLKPVGSGPFRFEGYEKRLDGFITTYKLSSWNQYTGDKALVGSLTFKFFSNKGELLEAFNSGRVDGLAGLEPDELAQINRPHETLRYTIPNYYAVFFNPNKSLPLKEPEVRRALSMVVDRENLLRVALAGLGRKASGPIPEDTPYFWTPEAVSSSLELASSTLDRAGWKMTSSTFREKTINKTKIPLEFSLVVPQSNFLTTTADSLQKAWERMGVKVQISWLTPEEILETAIKNRDYEMLLYGNVLLKNYDLFAFWHSSERFYPGLNLSLYSNKRADTLIESIRQTADKERHGELFQELQKVIIEDYPAIFLYSPDYIYVSGKNLHGVSGRLIDEPADRFAGARYWYVKTARVLK